MDAADGVVHEAPVEPHRQTEEGTRDHAEDRRERGDQEDVARADDHPREDIPAEPVGAEQVLRARRKVAPREVVERVIRRDRLAEDRTKDPDREDPHPDQKARLAQQDAERLSASLRAF